jgi:hypothetical protein
MPTFRRMLSKAAILRNLIALATVLFPAISFGESLLPPCGANEKLFLTNCQGSRAYPDGGKYVGEFRDNQANGQGTHLYFDGRKYVGEWRNGNFNGRGTLTYPYRGEYVGEFHDGKPDGQGAYAYSDGRKYIGGWRDGKFNGQGTFTYLDGRREVGEFLNNAYIGGFSANAPSDTPSVVSGGDEDNLRLLIPIALLILCAAAAIFATKAKEEASLARPASVSTFGISADKQSRVDEERRALLEAVEDFRISDEKLLELRENARRVFEELKKPVPGAARKISFEFLKLW